MVIQESQISYNREKGIPIQRESLILAMKSKFKQSK